MDGELVALEVPRGSGYDSQSGLNNLFPQVFGRLAAEGCDRRVAFVVIHPTSNFFGHYLFASVTAHVTAMIPVLLAVASTVPGIHMHTLALGLCLQLGIMGILTPYASGPSPVYYGSGYLPSADYWRLGAIFGVIFFAAFLIIGVPWMLFIR